MASGLPAAVEGHSPKNLAVWSGGAPTASPTMLSGMASVPRATSFAGVAYGIACTRRLFARTSRSKPSSRSFRKCGSRAIFVCDIEHHAFLRFDLGAFRQALEFAVTLPESIAHLEQDAG